MATKHVVDTHTLVWFLEGNPRLGANVKAVLEDADTELVLPVIALAEACRIIEHGRTSIPTVEDFLAAVDADPRVILVPLDRAVLDKTLAITAINGNSEFQTVSQCGGASPRRRQGIPR
jgi:PIN domain nuclease of toxin-antitoxin system